MGALSKFSSRYRADNADLALSHWDGFISNFSDTPAWLMALRTRGHDTVTQNGLPTQKLERFKYFNLPSYLKKSDLEYAKADITIDGAKEHVRVLTDCLNNADEWLVDVLTSSPVSEDKYGDMMLWDISNAYANDGVVIDVPANKHIENPINITVTGHAKKMTMSRNVVRIAAGASVVIVEYHMGASNYWHNNLTQIVLGKDARVKHYRIQENNVNACYTQNTHVQIENNGSYESFVMTSGAGLSRDQVHVDLNRVGAECYLNGINMLSGKQVGDTAINVEHHAPNCISKQNYRSVVDDKAVCNFQGKVHVHKVAQKTDGYQLSNTLLLSPQATMNTKPELEIYADDVKCSHGATSGFLDKEALFYMQSRGIPEKEARGLLIKAFLSEVIEAINDEAIAEQVALITDSWLSKRTDTKTTKEWL